MAAVIEVFVVVVVVVVVEVVVVVSSSSAVFFVDIVTAVLFCRNWTFELVVDMLAGLKKKKRRVEGGRSPPRGGVGGGGAPPICKRTRFSPSKSFEKKVVQY